MFLFGRYHHLVCNAKLHSQWVSRRRYADCHCSRGLPLCGSPVTAHSTSGSSCTHTHSRRHCRRLDNLLMQVFNTLQVIIFIYYCIIFRKSFPPLPHTFVIKYTHVHSWVGLSGHKTKPYIYKWRKPISFYFHTWWYCGGGYGVLPSTTVLFW